LPFTFAHPAAVLPFRFFNRRYVSCTGLFIGSLVPDTEYFVRFSDSTSWSHHWWGLFSFDLPVGLVCCFLFHNVVRDSLLRHLPLVIYRRVAIHRGFDWNGYFAKNWLAVSVSLLLGSTLHVLWDGLTHLTSDMVMKTGLLAAMDSSVRGILIYYGVWSLNSTLGLAALAISFRRLPAANRYRIYRGGPGYWLAVTSIAFLVITVRLFINSEVSVVEFVDSCISALLIALVATAVIKKKRLAIKKSWSWIYRLRNATVKVSGGHSHGLDTQNRGKVV
jgi:hypothetical protein